MTAALPGSAARAAGQADRFSGGAGKAAWHRRAALPRWALQHGHGHPTRAGRQSQTRAAQAERVARGPSGPKRAASRGDSLGLAAWRRRGHALTAKRERVAKVAADLASPRQRHVLRRMLKIRVAVCLHSEPRAMNGAHGFALAGQAQHADCFCFFTCIATERLDAIDLTVWKEEPKRRRLQYTSVSTQQAS